MLRALFAAGKARTANKLRAYLRAAYEVARKARTDPKIPEPFKAYGVKHNPAADTAANTSENRADKNPLDIDALRAYWRIIERMPGRKGALLRLHLLTGAQRIEQLVKLKLCDVTAAGITLFDGKGRPGKPPRPHPLPLLPAAAAALRVAMADDPVHVGFGDGMREPKPAPVFALSTDGGQTHIAATGFSAWACEAVGEQIEGFKAKRLRSGVETALAAAGVTKEVRGRLQSHGITGVQDSHYNAHDYMPEKLKGAAGCTSC